MGCDAGYWILVDNIVGSFKRPTMKKTILSKLLLVLSHFVIIITGCKKDDFQLQDISKNDQSSAFFKLAVNLPEPVNRVANLLRLKEQKLHFINNFISHQGIPLWKYAVVSQRPNYNSSNSLTPPINSLTDNDTIIKIPLQ